MFMLRGNEEILGNLKVILNGEEKSRDRNNVDLVQVIHHIMQVLIDDLRYEMEDLYDLFVVNFGAYFSKDRRAQEKKGQYEFEVSYETLMTFCLNTSLDLINREINNLIYNLKSREDDNDDNLL